MKDRWIIIMAKICTRKHTDWFSKSVLFPIPRQEQGYALAMTASTGRLWLRKDTIHHAGSHWHASNSWLGAGDAAFGTGVEFVCQIVFQCSPIRPNPNQCWLWFALFNRPMDLLGGLDQTNIQPMGIQSCICSILWNIDNVIKNNDPQPRGHGRQQQGFQF